jgi:hypothetical protein
MNVIKQLFSVTSTGYHTWWSRWPQVDGPKGHLVRWLSRIHVIGLKFDKVRFCFLDITHKQSLKIEWSLGGLKHKALAELSFPEICSKRKKISLSAKSINYWEVTFWAAWRYQDWPPRYLSWYRTIPLANNVANWKPVNSCVKIYLCNYEPIVPSSLLS